MSLATRSIAYKNSSPRKNPLKDSAILTLKDFERIKQKALSSSIDPPSHLTTSPNDDKRIREIAFRQKLIDYDMSNKYNHIADFDKDLISEQPADSKDKIQNSQDIKAMNKLMLYAKMATIRDRQLDERKVMEKMYRDKENKLDVMLEIERLKELKFQENKESEIKKQEKEGAQCLIDQIKENSYEKLKKKEALERERMHMMRQIEQLAEEEKRNAELKRIRNENTMKEAIYQNMQAKYSRQLKKIKEKEMDLEVMKFNMEKAKQEEAFLLEKKRQQEEREKELQLLREKQERGIDKQEELDAVRSKRAYELQEKEAREKEKRDLLLKQKMIEELLRENEMHIKKREEMKAEEEQREKDEFNKNFERQQNEIAKEKELKDQKKKEYQAYKDILLKEISERQDIKKIRKRELLEEGRKIKMEDDLYMKNLEAIKQQKIRELHDLNIKPKYIVDLEKYKIKGC